MENIDFEYKYHVHFAKEPSPEFIEAFNKMVKIASKLTKSDFKNEEVLGRVNHYCNCPTPALYKNSRENVYRCWSCHNIRQ